MSLVSVLSQSCQEVSCAIELKFVIIYLGLELFIDQFYYKIKDKKRSLLKKAKQLSCVSLPTNSVPNSMYVCDSSFCTVLKLSL